MDEPVGRHGRIDLERSGWRFSRRVRSDDVELSAPFDFLLRRLFPLRRFRRGVELYLHGLVRDHGVEAGSEMRNHHLEIGDQWRIGASASGVSQLDTPADDSL